MDKDKLKNLSLDLLNNGKNKLLEKDYNNAINLFTEALKLDNSNLDAKFYRSLSYLDSGLVKEAIQELQELLV